MAGFEVGIINIIADNLRDRYKNGFTVLKEIIQNADDAASQTGRDVQLDFGFTQGLPDAEHSLLKGPAIFFLNNGSFSEQDAKAIRSFGMNSKAADNASIGKFGLGMKSVFHFCEAFFWLAKDGNLKKAEILNPWSGSKEYPSPQSVWDNFPSSSPDVQLIQDHLRTVQKSFSKKYASYFLLWLPLRQKRQLNIGGEEVGSIISEFPGDDRKQIEFLFQPGLKKKLSTLLPLLRHLTRIQFWRPDKTQELQLQYTIQMKEGSQRNTYPDTKNTSLLSGVLTYNSNSADSKHHTLNFAGYEGRVPEVKLKKLRESDYWPKSYVRDELGRERPEPDKAKGHCAVTFSRSSKKTIGSLDIQWAVFLPVDTGREKISCKSEYAYGLTLHGFFFIDAGRSAIEGIDINESDVSFPPQSENDLRIAWNYFLVTRGTFILLIPALEKFIRQSKIGADEVKNLTASIASSPLFKDHRRQICRLHQWVLQIVPQGSKWMRIKSDQKILPLPAPPQKKPNQPWETFPNLSDLEDVFIFIQKNDPVSENFDREIYHLTTTRISLWDEETLLTVLNFDSEKVFSSLSIVNYLKLFLQNDSVPDYFLKVSSIQNRLKNLVREGFLRIGLKMSQVTSGVQEIVSLILPEYKYIIKSDAHTVIMGLQEVDSGFLILHKDFDSPNSSGTAKLTKNDSLRFLENLDQQLRNYEIKGENKNAEKCREVIL
jgi:hypothetical protein